MNDKKPDLRVIALNFLAVLVFMAVLLFWPAGTIWWKEAWIMLAFFVLQVSIDMTLLETLSPGLLQERFRPGPGAKKWDTFILVGLLVTVCSTFLSAGLDHRYGWTPHLAVLKPAVLLYFVGGCIISWSMTINPFFSKVVRIQTDRGHHLIDSGPYRLVRHPGYTGWLLQWLAVPLILNALLSFIPVLCTTALLVIRTKWEDETLALELPGYQQYRGRVQFRLFPGVW